ncbi:MAG: hypothetical protein ACK4N4_10850 [Burkholderiales bacterium]
MNIVIYVFSGLFLILTAGLLFAAWHTQHGGLLLMAIVYGVAAGLALALMQWWPLAAGLALAWAMKMLGLAPAAGAAQGGDRSKRP